MTREELKEHCKRQIQQFERVEKIMPVTPYDWKRYEEHKLILELLEQEPTLDKIRAEIKAKYDIIPWRNNDYDDGWIEALEWVLDDVIDEYMGSEG